MNLKNKAFLAGLSLIAISLTLSACSSSEGDSRLDSGAGSNNLISVSDVRECGGEDGTTWYWAPCFKVELEPFTKMQCKIQALDANGDVVATMENEFNTLNDGSTTGYGDGAGTQDTTEEIYKSIKSLDVACHL